MTKSELVTVVAHKTGRSRAEVDLIVSNVVDVISDTMANGDAVRLVDFGKFWVKRREAFTMKSHISLEYVEVKEKIVAKFTPAKALKDKLNA